MNIHAFTKSYNGRRVLDMPEFEFERGKIYAVIGSNGSGKSTLAKMLAGIERPDDNRLVCSCASVGYLPQKSYAFRMSVRKNIALNGSDSARLESLMSELRIKPLENQRADKLSGGETARMALARLMMGKYELVILDEPTAPMDMESTLLAEDLIVRYCHESGCALLHITHSLQQARRIADEIIFLHQGQLAEYGIKEKILYSPEKDSTKQFLEFYGI